MCFIFKNNWVRSIWAACLFFIGMVIVIYVVITFDGNFSKAFVLMFISCTALLYSSKRLLELYGGIEGNADKYDLRPYLSINNTNLSKGYVQVGVRKKSIFRKSFYLFPWNVESFSKLTVNSRGHQKLSSTSRHRMRLLAQYLYIWLRKQNKKRELRSTSVQYDHKNCSKTYAVSSIFKQGLSLTCIDVLSVVTDQKLLTHELALEGVVLSSPKYLLKDEPFFVIDLPQETDLAVGLCMHVLFITSDGYIVPHKLIECNFMTYYLGDLDTSIESLCTKQICRHLEKTPFMPKTNALGMYLSIEDAGAPTVACIADVGVSLDEIFSYFCQTFEERILLDDYLTSVDDCESIIKYFLQKNKKEGVRCGVHLI